MFKNREEVIHEISRISEGDNRGSLVPDKSELGPEKGGDVRRFSISTSWGRIFEAI